MIEFNVNENAGGGGGFTPVPAGTYDLQIDDVEIGQSKKGNPQLTVKGHIAEGPKENRKVTVWYSLVPAAGWKLKKLLDATGVEYVSEMTEGAENISCDEADLVGCYVRMQCSVGEYNGRAKNDWTDEEASPFGMPAAGEKPPVQEPETRRRRSRASA